MAPDLLSGFVLQEEIIVVLFLPWMSLKATPQWPFLPMVDPGNQLKLDLPDQTQSFGLSCDSVDCEILSNKTVANDTSILSVTLERVSEW